MDVIHVLYRSQWFGLGVMMLIELIKVFNEEDGMFTIGMSKVPFWKEDLSLNRIRCQGKMVCLSSRITKRSISCEIKSLFFK